MAEISQAPEQPPKHDGMAIGRLTLTLIGALAGAAVYVLSEVAPEYIHNDRLFFWLTTVTGTFFAAFLAATGPLSFKRAAVAALIASFPASILLFWASFRFASVHGFLDTLSPLVAFVAIVMISLPFLIAQQRPGEGWRSYPALFTQSWNIVVRYVAAWAFVGVFWGVILLSNLLFKLVGLTVIEQLLEIDLVPFVLTGAVLGLAMAVVVELSDYISPFLILRLLRLLVPVVLVVTVVFLVALPIRGLSDLFDGLSAAATLIAMAMGVATLITSALDETDVRAVTGRIMGVSTQILALSVPILAGLAIYSVWIRVADYGVSPDRLTAGLLGLIVLGYGLCYAVAVARRRNWMADIRRANIGMALVTVLASILWLTPVINPQRISANNQYTRFVNGQTPMDKLDLWFIKQDLGVAGEGVLSRLEALDHQDSAELNAKIARLRASENWYEFDADTNDEKLATLRTDFAGKITVFPENSNLPSEVFDEFSERMLLKFINGCDRSTPAGNAGCVVVFGDFVESSDGQEAILIYARSRTRAELQALWPDIEGAPYARLWFLNKAWANNVGIETIDAIHSGEFKVAPARINSLQIGDGQIIILP